MGACSPSQDLSDPLAPGNWSTCMGLGRGAWLASTAIPSMLESRLPAWLPSQVRESAEGSAWWGRLPRTRLAWRPGRGPVPGDLSHDHPGVAQVLSSQQRRLEDSPRSPCHTWMGCPHNTWDSPVTWHHPPWGPRVLTVCVGGPGVTPGESGNLAQVTLCWGAATGKGASLGPAWSQEGGRGGGAPTQLCTHRSGQPGP